MPAPRPTAAQRRYLLRGLNQPGGKLPLFDERGQRVNGEIVRTCIRNGWAEPWFTNPMMPDWLVCRLTEAGREVSMRLADAGLRAVAGPDDELVV